MRPMLKHLGDVAERTGCALVILSHLNKRSGQSAYRGLGTIDIYAAARSVLTIGKLPFDDNMRAIVHTKANLSTLGKSQAFGVDEFGNFTWLGDCDATVDDVMGVKPKKESQFIRARRILESKLANGAVAVIEFMQIAEMEGISFKTFKRVKESLGIISYRKNGQWYWAMPIDVVYEDKTYEGQVRLVPLKIFKEVFLWQLQNQQVSFSNVRRRKCRRSSAEWN